MVFMEKQKSNLNQEVEVKFIPLDKSWIIRMGVLDILNGYKDTIKFLKRTDNLNGDLISLLRASEEWDASEIIHVGESGTLYRFLRFASWKLNLDKEFVLEGTLQSRDICEDPAIINWQLSDLLKLDKNTSQWASAAILLGNTQRVENPPHKLQLTYEAVEHWKSRRLKGEVWLPRCDVTILIQATSFVHFIRTGDMQFKAMQPEDYCFARAFELIDEADGKRQWPSLAGHESNRFVDMKQNLRCFEEGTVIESKDHRVVQAIAMLAKARRKEVKFAYPDSVNKSWPQFWEFISHYTYG